MRIGTGKIRIREFDRLVLLMVLCISALMLAACKGPDADEAVVITELILPTDTLLNLACKDVGINSETCVLDDPENPFRFVATREFDVNNPDAETKYDLFDRIPLGPTGAKARFYLWATALARRNSGENQYLTALALHELFTTNEDPIIREQAKSAYRSVWDNFFGSVIFFECCGEFFPSPREDTTFAVPLNELVLERLVRAREFPGPSDPNYPSGYTPLIPDDLTGLDAGLIELETQEVIGQWGYNYVCTGAGAARQCFVSVNDG